MTDEAGQGVSELRRVEWDDEYRKGSQDRGLLLPLPEAYFVERGADPEEMSFLMGRAHTVFDMSGIPLVSELPLRHVKKPVGTALAVVGQAAPSLAVGTTEIWHYTDAAGLIGMIDSGVLWASSVAALNDAAEYSYGQSILDSVMTEALDSPLLDTSSKENLVRMVGLSRDLAPVSEIYTLSASTAAHSLAQWRAYGGDQGHALILDPQGPLAIVTEEPAREDGLSTRLRPTWRHVLYEPAPQRELLLGALGYISFMHQWESAFGFTGGEDYEATLALEIAEAVLHCKEPSFAEEQEVRMVFQPAPTDRVHFRAAATGVTPFLKVTGVANPRQLSTNEITGLPLKGAAVGPFHTRDSSGAGVRLLLRKKLYDAARVETSTSSLR